MSHASGIEHLRPFLPGLESILADPDVSEVMINGPHVVWIEREGRLVTYPAPDLDGETLMRAAIQICRPLSLDPAKTPTIDARLADGSRVAVCVPPASPEVTITVRRFGNRTFSAEDLVEMGSLPPELLVADPRHLGQPSQHPGLRGDRLGQDDVAQCLDCVASQG